ncbi:type VI secretion system Vgr family protein [Uliginosibacterium paludis]|uniref:Type VI secretion system Vgr family protein n=1 Tax=Uliginosibacterium paludis TaxID=1615952 RepID=A0ABV2CQ27_9RHOO
MNASLSSIADALRSLISGHTDASRLIRLRTADSTETLMVERLDGFEEIIPAQESSAGFRFELRVLSSNAFLSPESWLGQPVLVELLTAQSRSELRPFSGHVTAFESLAGDGGFGHYRLTIEPWLAFLAYRRDSYVFHDMSVIEIVDAVLGDWRSKGTLNPLWRWVLADASVYRKRSVCTQYRETDLAFISRLMAEEGLYAWFEHASGSSAADARHTLVIADQMDAFPDNAQAQIRFHRAAATETSDTIQHLVSVRSLASHSVTLASWDYRSLDARSSTAAGSADGHAADIPMTRFDAPGMYAWPDRETGERMARRLQEAIDARQHTLSGESTVRTLCPGTRFTLLGHFDADAPEARNEADRDRYAVIRVSHHARNNLGTTLSSRLTELHTATGTVEVAGGSEDALYRNDFVLLPAALPWRAATLDASGRLLRPRPVVSGSLSAIVVGEAGQPVHTDRDGRIRIQFHWQRGTQSHSRQSTPSGDDNAPGSTGSWSWVRVMSQWAGANWGAAFVPRAGQEVLVSFIEGDIDRPIVVGSLYNGQGAESAQGNRIARGAGVATGNAPAWFAGTDTQSSTSAGEGHAHPAVLAGIKTQAMSASQTGSGGFNQLVFDLTPGEPRAQLASTQYASSLNLGTLRHQFDNQRKAFRGHGAELATDESGALRAGSGLLLSSDARSNASGMQMDARLATSQLESAKALVQALAESAAKQKARLEGDPAADKLPVTEQLGHSNEVLSATETQKATEKAEAAANVPAWSEPMIAIESPAGINALTPKDAILNAGNTLSLTAADIHLAAQGKSAWAVKDGIVLYTYGKQSDTKRPVGDTGLKLHAAQGKVSIQAQSDKADFNADKKITLTSTTKDVLLQGKNDLQLTAAGAAIQISGGNITLVAPGKVSLLASQRNLTSGKSDMRPASLPTPGELSLTHPQSGPHSVRFAALGADALLADSAWANQPYLVVDGDGKTLAKGVIPESGRLPRVTTEKPEDVVLVLGSVDETLWEPIQGRSQSASSSATDEEDALNHDEAALERETAKVIASRYYQETLAATSHHGNEFLSPEQIRAALDLPAE